MANPIDTTIRAALAAIDEATGWHSWEGVIPPLLYARRLMSSPPRVVRATSPDGLLAAIRRSDAIRAPAPTVPAELREAGLTTWPDRGSDLAHLAVMAWEHARRRVEITYEAGDALWCVAEHDGPERVFCDRYDRAAVAFNVASALLASPLPGGQAVRLPG